MAPQAIRAQLKRFRLERTAAILLLVVAVGYGSWLSAVYLAPLQRPGAALASLEVLARINPLSVAADRVAGDILWDQVSRTGNIAWIGMARDHYDQLIRRDPDPALVSRYAWLRVVSGR